MELEKGNYVCLVLIDLSLAFDTLECGKILPNKMVKMKKTVKNGRSLSSIKKMILNMIYTEEVAHVKIVVQ